VAVSIKVRESTKRRLERLQADLASKGGKDLSFQELLDVIVKYASTHTADILGETSPIRFPLSAAARRRLHNRTYDFGGETSEEEIDRVLYSDEAIHGDPKRSDGAR